MFFTRCCIFSLTCDLVTSQYMLTVDTNLNFVCCWCKQFIPLTLLMKTVMVETLSDWNQLSYIGVGFLTITFPLLFKLSQESTKALMILQTAPTVGTGFALFARPLTSCVLYIQIRTNLHLPKVGAQIVSGVLQNACKWVSGGAINACKGICQWWRKMNESLRGYWVMIATPQRKHMRTRQQRFNEFLQTLIRVDFQLGVKIIWGFIRGLFILQGLIAESNPDDLIVLN